MGSQTLLRLVRPSLLNKGEMLRTGLLLTLVSGGILAQGSDWWEKQKDLYSQVLSNSFVAQGNLQHCPNSQTDMKCRRGSGPRLKTSNRRVWNPMEVVSIGMDNILECYPCCSLPNRSIDQCQGNAPPTAVGPPDNSGSDDDDETNNEGSDSAESGNDGDTK